MVYGVNDMPYVVEPRDPLTQSEGVVAGYAQTAAARLLPACHEADFLGWGRAATNGEGIYSFKTVRPGARYINFLILYSGLMRHLQTAMFFDKAPDARLIGKKEGPNRYRFDIRLRGEGETPFFDD